MTIKLVTESDVWRDEVNAACITRLEELLEKAKSTGLTGFAMAWTEKGRAASTTYTITDERYALIGAVAELQSRIIARSD
jgi:hypothetical protein